MSRLQFAWVEPWQAVQLAADVLSRQRELELEITPLHPLYGRGATIVGCRKDNDDVLVVLSDGTFANVHLIWSGGPDTFPDQYPSWFIYGSEADFEKAMAQDAREYGGGEA